ncbi:cytochrome P450 [Deinococcus pimensis]|uniref:cytochrome P450 n=1 Tax=Deinococcus pimensis TaxID=309888 RepID=UPI000480819E|nr:cytochrome P450 [Deinococcus pimensis]
MTLAALPPAPRRLPLVGHVPFVARDVLGYMEHVTRAHGDVVRLDLAGREVWVLGAPADIEFVHVNSGRLFDKGLRGDPILSALLGNGLLVSEDDFWLRQRRLAQPAFHHRRVAAYADLMAAEGTRLLGQWQPGRTRDLHLDMTKLTLNIVAKAVLDTDPGERADAVSAAIDEVLTEFHRSLGRPVKIPRNDVTPGWRRVNRGVEAIDRVGQAIIDERRASGEDRGDLLSMLMLARDDEGRGMSDRQLLDEVKNIFLAGHDTTATTMTFAFSLLATHPSVESRLHTELDEVLGGRAPTMEDLPRLAFTDAVIKETLRLYPAAWSTQRRAKQPVRVGDFDAPAGTVFWINHWVTHRDPRFFDAPTEFRPERWLAPDFERSLPKYAYFPFGGGPRVCIGREFARMEALVLLATIAQRYRLRLVGDMPVPEPAISLRPRGEVRMTLHARR